MKRMFLALIAVPFLLVATGCQPECVDYFDCATKAKAADQEFTCDNGTCKAGTPFKADGGT